MPAISSALRRGSFLARLRRLVSGSPVDRSIFGARLRTRWPQYGHSVTYGLTSAEQFLQTTKRSGSVIATEDTQALQRSRLVALARLLDDLAHDFAQVVVRLEDDHLARGAVALL